MFIRNISVFKYSEHAKDSVQHKKNVYVTQLGTCLILDAGSEPPGEITREFDAQGETYFLLPGMLDAHVHGQGGPDFADMGETPQHLPVITAALGKTGLAYAMATFVSLELSTLKKALAATNAYVKEQEKNPTLGATKIVGVHLEGPFIANNCRGAHAESALQSSISLEKFQDIISVAPNIKEWKITLAPDLPGAQDFIKDAKRLENEGIFVKVFIGHSNPENKAIVGRAIEAGAVGFTHLGNACQETCCREARALEKQDATSHVVQWVLENPQHCPPGVELIVDGVHLSQSFVSLVRKTIGDEKIVLVTDALGPAGLNDGLYKLGTLAILKEKNNFYLADEMGDFIMKQGKLSDGRSGQVKSLAGSAASLSFCAQQYCAWMTELEEAKENKIQAIYTTTVVNPRVSSLSPQAIKKLPEDRNFVILDKHGQLVLSLCNGKLLEHQKGVIPSPEKKGNASILASQGLLKTHVQKENNPKSSSNAIVSPSQEIIPSPFL